MPIAIHGPVPLPSTKCGKQYPKEKICHELGFALDFEVRKKCTDVEIIRPLVPGMVNALKHQNIFDFVDCYFSITNQQINLL